MAAAQPNARRMDIKKTVMPLHFSYAKFPKVVGGLSSYPQISGEIPLKSDKNL